VEDGVVFKEIDVPELRGGAQGGEGWGKEKRGR